MTNLPSDALVLELGSGSNPWARSDVLLDRFYVDETGQRGGMEIYRDRRPMLVAAGERLPFKDKSFDFLYCCHVIEHAEDISSMLREMSRVAKAGFIECPNPLLEKILDQDQHNWYVVNRDNKLLIARKQKPTNLARREDRFYFHIMSDHLLVRHNWSQFVTRLHWSDSIDFEIWDEPRAVMDAQPIAADLPLQIQRKLILTLMHAVSDAVKEKALENAKRFPGARSVHRWAKQAIKNRRDAASPRVTPSVLANMLACPHCRSDLRGTPAGFVCLGCARDYPNSGDVAVLL